MTAIALVLLVVAAGLLLVRAVLGPNLADRAVALDGLLSVIAAGVIVAAARRGEVATIDIAVTVALVGFIGTAIVGRYIERRGP
jgi:multicomponent Na+:H+ antiporter subunit F